jgi:hypothetical protein
MKKPLILLFSFFSVALLAQDVKEISKSMSLGPQMSYYIEIDNISKKVVEKEWKKFLKQDFKKVKYNRKAKEFYTENGKVGVINGSDPITIYSKLSEGKGQVTLYTWTELSNGVVNSSDYRKQSDGLNTYLQDFYIIAKKKGISIELDKEEDRLKRFNKDLSKLEKKNKDLHADIEKYKNKISKAESDIEANLKSQDDKRVEIEAQKKIVEEVIERLNMVGKDY